MQVLDILCGASTTGDVYIVFKHADGSQYSTRLERSVLARLITVLEQAHAHAVAQVQGGIASHAEVE